MLHTDMVSYREVRQADYFGAIDFNSGARWDWTFGHEAGGDERLAPLGYGASEVERIHVEEDIG